MGSNSSRNVLEVLEELSRRIEPNLDEHRLLYAQSRLVTPELMRGRAKFSVVLSAGGQGEEPPPAQVILRRLADNVEDGMLTWLSRERGLSRARCRVSGKERWLRYPRTIR